jgi:hypothetical protein
MPMRYTGQEPLGPDTHHRHVVGVHDHGEATDLIAVEGDRIGGGHEDSAGDPDGVGVFPDAGTEREFGR